MFRPPPTSTLFPYTTLFRSVALLATARAECDRLIVALNTDRGVRRLKGPERPVNGLDRKSTRLNSSHITISYAVFCLKKKKKNKEIQQTITPTHEQTDPTKR